MSTQAHTPILDGAIVKQAAVDALAKLAPSKMVRNPVMFVTAVVALLVTVLFVRDALTGRGGLLFSVAATHVDAVLARLARLNTTCAAVIGRVVKGAPRIRISI